MAKSAFCCVGFFPLLRFAQNGDFASKKKEIVEVKMGIDAGKKCSTPIQNNLANGMGTHTLSEVQRQKAHGNRSPVTQNKHA